MPMIGLDDFAKRKSVAFIDLLNHLRTTGELSRGMYTILMLEFAAVNRAYDAALQEKAVRAPDAPGPVAG